LPLKLIGGAVALAAIFIVAAIVGGGGEKPDVEGAAPPVSGASQDEPAPSDVEADELGYPAFATKNTTRVGGADPAANAAGTALAVYPGTTEDDRPPAVTFVDAGDWAGGIAASVLMAAPIGAPVLVSDGEQLPNVSSEALTRLDPQGSKATGGAQVFSIGNAAAPAGDGTERVEGGGGAATAAGVAALRERLVGKPPRHVVVAPLEKPAFAMPAAAWAARSGDPVLFAGRDRLPPETAAALRKHPKVPVYVLGPSAAISSDVLRKIVAIAPTVHRIAGEDPVQNAIALARYSDGDFGWNVNDPGHGFVVARDDEPLDAAAASPLSASGTWGPLLLSDDAGTLPAALRDYLLDVKPGYTDDPTRAFYNHVWVIGDQEAIEVGQQAEIDSLAELVRIGGEE
ncbi:MAG TPA: hypothetical protein VIT85_01515, partial [Solirubrobacterales bacterium]